jgi:hypothetical protein
MAILCNGTRRQAIDVKDIALVCKSRLAFAHLHHLEIERHSIAIAKFFHLCLRSPLRRSLRHPLAFLIRATEPDHALIAGCRETNNRRPLPEGIPANGRRLTYPLMRPLIKLLHGPLEGRSMRAIDKNPLNGAAFE